MGSRIHKQIGYFIDKPTAKKIFVNPTQLDKIIDNLYDNDYDEVIFQQFMENAKNLEPFFNHLSQTIQTNWEAKKFSLSSLFHQIFFHDTFKGYLLSIPDEAIFHRRDDLIDYYDSTTSSELKLLNMPIYPVSGFAYRGDPSNPHYSDYISKFPNKSFLDAHEALMLYQIMIDQKTLELSDKARAKMVKSRLFTPRISPQVFCIAKAFGILKDPNMSHSEFDSYCKPALLKYWS